MHREVLSLTEQIKLLRKVEWVGMREKVWLRTARIDSLRHQRGNQAWPLLSFGRRPR
jgi:hypothetical protein